jgi:hypothetical protein
VFNQQPILERIFETCTEHVTHRPRKYSATVLYIVVVVVVVAKTQCHPVVYTHEIYTVLARGILKTMCFEFEYCFESHTFTFQESIIVTYA